MNFSMPLPGLRANAFADNMNIKAVYIYIIIIIYNYIFYTKNILYRGSGKLSMRLSYPCGYRDSMPATYILPLPIL